MLEPVIIRQTATLSEWNGTNGTATTDNGTIFPLNLSNMQRDLFGRLPEKGARVELYLHQNERGETEFVECCIMPSFDNQGGYSLQNEIYEKTKGRKFYVDLDTSQRSFFGDMFWNCFFFAAMARSFGLTDGNFDLGEDWLFICLMIGKILLDCWSWREIKRNPQNKKTWLFTLNHQGIAFQLHRHRDGYLTYWRSWADMESFSLEKSKILKRPYWQIQCKVAGLGKHKIPLHTLSETERELAQKMAQEYFDLR